MCACPLFSLDHVTQNTGTKQVLCYSFQEEESGGSSTDMSACMSVCRSEPLFSSMRDSEMQSELNPSDIQPKGASAVHCVGQLGGPPQDSLIQDSLTDEDFNFSEKVTVNKNNYTLTYSGQGVIGSFIASMVSSTGALLEPPGKQTVWEQFYGLSRNLCFEIVAIK